MEEEKKRENEIERALKIMLHQFFKNFIVILMWFKYYDIRKVLGDFGFLFFTWGRQYDMPIFPFKKIKGSVSGT